MSYSKFAEIFFIIRLRPICEGDFLQFATNAELIFEIFLKYPQTDLKLPQHFNCSSDGVDSFLISAYSQILLLTEKLF